MTEKHPITPPPELVQQWFNQANKLHEPYITYIATHAARWGWDQRKHEIQAAANAELEACIDWMSNARNHGLGWDLATILSGKLRAARRPKPPSLKEQAIAVLEDANLDAVHYNTILRALEALPE